MTVTIIGCGDAFGSGGRFQTCFAIETAGRRVLVDCGVWVANYYSARNPLRLSSLVIPYGAINGPPPHAASR